MTSDVDYAVTSAFTKWALALDLKRERVAQILVSSGSEFQMVGPDTPNEHL